MFTTLTCVLSGTQRPGLFTVIHSDKERLQFGSDADWTTVLLNVLSNCEFLNQFKICIIAQLYTSCEAAQHVASDDMNEAVIERAPLFSISTSRNNEHTQTG